MRASQVVLVVKNPPTNAGDIKRRGFDPWIRKIPWKKAWQPTPVFLPGKFNGQRSLAGCSPWGCKEWDTTKQLSTHTYPKQLSACTHTHKHTHNSQTLNKSHFNFIIWINIKSGF